VDCGGRLLPRGVWQPHDAAHLAAPPLRVERERHGEGGREGNRDTVWGHNLGTQHSLGSQSWDTVWGHSLGTQSGDTVGDTV